MMSEKKTWLCPAIDELDINQTQFTLRKGADEDGYTYNCEPLYTES